MDYNGDVIKGLHCSTIFDIIIGLTPIMHVAHVRNKISNIQGRSPYVVKVIFHTIMNCP